MLECQVCDKPVNRDDNENSQILLNATDSLLLDFKYGRENQFDHEGRPVVCIACTAELLKRNKEQCEAGK